MNTAGRVFAVFGFLAVALGAFGAHALKGMLAASGVEAIWSTAVFYHLTHSVAGLFASRISRWTSLLWVAGIGVFSGSLYALCLSGWKWLGAVTPLGGMLLLAGWVCLVLTRTNQSETPHLANHLASSGSRITPDPPGSAGPTGGQSAPQSVTPRCDRSGPTPDGGCGR